MTVVHMETGDMAGRVAESGGVRLRTLLLFAVYAAIVVAAWCGVGRVVLVQAGWLPDTRPELNQFLGGQPRFTTPTAGRVLEGTFQRDIEDTSGDSFPGAMRIMQTAGRCKGGAARRVLGVLPESWRVVLPAGAGDFVRSADGRRLFPAPAVYQESEAGRARAMAAHYSAVAARLPGVRICVHVVPAYENSSVAAGMWAAEAARVLRGLRHVEEFAAALDRRVACDWTGRGRTLAGLDELYLNSDHHLTMRGGYQMYRSVHRMLADGRPELGPAVEPRGWRELPGIGFLGAHARAAAGCVRTVEPLVDMVVDLPPHRVVVHGAGQGGAPRNQRAVYQGGVVPVGLFVNHYGEYFGWDHGLIEYVFPDRPDELRLLVVSDSIDNLIEPVLASHFGRAWFADLREYELDMGREFDLDRFVAEQRVTDVAFIGVEALVLGLAAGR